MSAPRNAAPDWSTVRTAADCARHIETIFADDLRSDAGVVHVTAALHTPHAGVLSVLRIGPHGPRSSTDAFVLSVARARADAIVTTGRILRAEPGVTHALGGPAEQAVARWRSAVARKTTPPVSVVLTGRADLDLGHPLLRRAARAIVWSPPEVAAELARRSVPDHVEILPRPDSSLRDALADLAQRIDAATLLLEAGPHTSRPLYEEPAAIDELMLSVFEGGSGARAVDVAGELLAPDALARLFGAPRSEHRSREESGGWRFLRYRRARGADFSLVDLAKEKAD